MGDCEMKVIGIHLVTFKIDRWSYLKVVIMWQ